MESQQSTHLVEIEEQAIIRIPTRDLTEQQLDNRIKIENTWRN
jgi:hypothetical protein